METLAHRAAMLILEEFNVDWVRLSVNKPGAIRHSKDVGVAVLRTRADLARRQMTAPKPGHVRVFVAAGSNVEPEKNLARACAEIAHTWPDARFLARLPQRCRGLRRTRFHQSRGRVSPRRSRWSR